MKFDEFQVGEYSEYDIFNVLHDLYQEIPLNEMQTRNKLFFPKVKISRAWATPNDTFISRKNVVMIGAGSGISPYLPLLEEVIKNDQGMASMLKFESVKLVFVAREGEQISWVSNFLFHVLSSKWVIPELEFSIYITLEKNLKTLPSFLFWRAFLLIGLSKQIWGIKNESTPRLFYQDGNDNKNIDKDEIKKLSLKIIFGRPRFRTLLKNWVKPNLKEMYVYSTTSPLLNEYLFDATINTSKDTGIKIYHIYESAS